MAHGMAQVFGLESISLYGFGPFTAPAVFFFYMAGNFFIYLTIVYLCDSGALGRAWRRIHGRGSMDPLPLPAYSVRHAARWALGCGGTPSSAHAPAVLGPPRAWAQDSDVNAEKDRIHQMSEKDRDMLTICDLRRVYPSRGRIPSRVAVNDLCLGVPAGQCFGLLGPNGAGKTTTMKMLTGDDAPQGGDAWINNRSVRNSLSEVYKVMGYCPQFDQVRVVVAAARTRARTRAR